ncbi:MAG: phosphoribosylglycinamide formyltransferase [Bacteriovoracaceae bacterium]|nr:phosphoribosylglycinamide formyltransferase [Bacteriovoracaceae bacterium]
MEISKIRFAVFASGNGTNAENIFTHIGDNPKSEVCCLVTDNQDAFVVTRAKNHGINYHIVEKSSGDNKIKHEKNIVKILDTYKPDWILLAGYMRILSPFFLEKFSGKKGQSRVINIHPSMLPKFKGMDAYRQAYDANVDTSGVTVHFVDSGIDTGSQIMQESFPRYRNDTFDDFKSRGMNIEYTLYRKVIDQITGQSVRERCDGYH